MAVTFKFPPFPEADVDHYNVYVSDGGDPPVFSKIGEVPQGTDPVLEFTDAGSPDPDDDFYIASALVDQTELLVSPVFKPSDLDRTVRLFGRILNLANQPIPRVEVRVALSVERAARHGNVIDRTVIVVSDDTGLWSVDLFPNADLLPAGTRYWVEFDRSRGGRAVDIVVPVDADLVYFPSLVSFV